MPRWKSSEVEAFMRTLPGVKSIVNTGPGGDVDTDNIQIEFEDSNDHLIVRGFNPDMNYSYTDTSDAMVDYVEVSDGQQSSGGLSSFNQTTGDAYVAIRRFFGLKGFFVVESLDNYF
jgi:hypothetical protein